MNDDLTQVYQAIEERDVKCRQDLKELEGGIRAAESIKVEFASSASQLGTTERKELAKVDALREHAGALKRHMENTSAYLKKEVKAVEVKIDEAKAIMLKNIGVNIDDFETVVDKD